MKKLTLITLTAVLLPSCSTLTKLKDNDSVAALLEAFRNAPLVLETEYKGKVVRIVIREGKAVAISSAGEEVPLEEVVDPVK